MNQISQGWMNGMVCLCIQTFGNKILPILFINFESWNPQMHELCLRFSLLNTSYLINLVSLFGKWFWTSHSLVKRWCFLLWKMLSWCLEKLNLTSHLGIIVIVLDTLYDCILCWMHCKVVLVSCMHILIFTKGFRFKTTN